MWTVACLLAFRRDSRPVEDDSDKARKTNLWKQIGVVIVQHCFYLYVCRPVSCPIEDAYHTAPLDQLVVANFVGPFIAVFIVQFITVVNSEYLKFIYCYRYFHSSYNRYLLFSTLISCSKCDQPQWRDWCTNFRAWVNFWLLTYTFCKKFHCWQTHSWVKTIKKKN